MFAVRDSAQMALPRTIGAGSVNKDKITGIASAFFKFPSAIKTLRINRSRPMRIIAVFEKSIFYCN